VTTMTQPYSIASVTVAYNGAAVLPRQLDALRRQTQRLNEIIVVNNASSDDTASVLEKHYPEATVLNQLENVGVGGGFAAGLQYAVYEKKHDWIWLLDQDSIPADDCLERLIAGFAGLGDRAEQTAIMAPVCMNSESEVDYAPSRWRNGLWRMNPEKNQRIFFVDSAISSGTLLRKEAVEEVGLPRADFFMDFVDHEYCLRLHQQGYKIAVVADARLEHTLGETIPSSVLGMKKNWIGHAPWREYYMARNEIFTIWKYFPGWRAKSITGRRLLRHALGVLLFGRQKLACLAMMCRGVADGRAGRLGIRHFDH
jgi:GT2 family glycosyltransferase